MNVIRVGAFELYPSERRLCRAGKPVEVGARAFDLLLALVEHQGRLATKAMLLERVWPRLIVDENNLPAQIASLRRILGPGAIRTVQGYGYRLELEVSAGQSASRAEPSMAIPRDREPPQLSVPRRAWPNRLGSLIGRDDDVRNVREALGRSSLVSVVGIAGVGKTRLAQEILEREAQAPDASVAWVSLGPVHELQHVPTAIALALGLALPDDLDGFVALSQLLERVPLLLILDNAEHLRDVLALPLATLISQTQAVRVLVTSQAPLGIAGETVYRLQVLPAPPPDTPLGEAAQFAAVALFVERASAADRRFALSAANAACVADICRKLDGIPLALELAAARVPALGLAALHARLDDRFRLLRSSGQQPDSRRGALHTAFEWSYGLLTSQEQRVFNRLSAFAGSFSLTAAARCVADETIDTCEAVDLIGRLVDRSLVTALAVDPPRYALPETARIYALGRLAAHEEQELPRARMANIMLEVLDLAYQEYWGLDEAVWLHRYAPEINNVRAAIEWAAGSDHALAVALFGSAWPLFVETDLHAEGRARYSQLLGLLSDSLPRTRVGRFWEAIATYDSTRQSDRAHYAAELAATTSADTDDKRGHYYALMLLALNSGVDADTARSSFDAARRLENPSWPARLLAWGASTEGALLSRAERFAEARIAYQRALRLALSTGERQALAVTVRLVELDVACGNIADALQLGRPLAVSLRHVGRRETRFELLVLSFSALLIEGQIDEARVIAAELYEPATQMDAGKLYSVLDAMALLACQEQRHDVAARIAAYADTAYETHGQLQRAPAAKRVRAVVEKILDERLGSAWRTGNGGERQQLDEITACSLALAVRA
jgi:predicted ATPase/DNA-binding winged helix-turn-helix (wHTH) protein